MVKSADSWALPARKPITKAVLDRAIATEEAIAAREHHVQEAWFDRQHDALMLLLTDGRVFGAARSLIPSLQDASPKQLRALRTTEDGAFLVIDILDLHINIDGLITRLMEESPSTIRRAGARLVGMATSPAKAATSVQNGRLGGRPKKKPKKSRETV